MSRGPNPFSNRPGAPPARLVGRSTLLGEIDDQLSRLRRSVPAEAIAVSGTAGSGVTVLLAESCRAALGAGWAAAVVTVGGDDVRVALGAGLRAALDSVAELAAATSRPRQPAEVVEGFARSPGALHEDLGRTLQELGAAFPELDRGLVLFVDGAPRLGDELPAVADMLCRQAADGVSATLVLGGLPCPTGQMSRLGVPPLGVDQIDLLVVGSAAERGVTIRDDAVDAIAAASRGVPFLVQSFAESVWNSTTGDTITATDVDAARAAARESIRSVWYEPRIAGLTGTERRYLAAVAEAGGDDVEIGHITRRLGDSNRFTEESSTLRSVRDGLARRGLIHSTDDRTVSFSLPSFVSFLALTHPA